MIQEILKGIIIGAFGGEAAGLIIWVFSCLNKRHSEKTDKKFVYAWLYKATKSDDNLKWRSTRAIASHNNLKEQLEKAGFKVKSSYKKTLQGKSPKNICNQGQTGKGVKLELSNALRRNMFANLKHSGRKDTTNIFRNFVSALREALPG